MKIDELVDYNEETMNVTKKDTKKTQNVAQFKDFLLRDELIKVINDLSMEHPNEVQQMAIPKAILGQDILCQAKSGTGKTAVFVIATLQQLTVVPKETSIIVVVHTREMAEQIKGEYARFIKYFENITVDAFYGGVDVQTNIAWLKEESPTILIGTPGRLADLIERNVLNLRHVKFFVIDECDKIVESLYHRNDAQTVFVSSPRNKQTLMFTATLTKFTHEECMRFLDNPFVIRVDDEAKLTLYGLKQYHINIKPDDKKNKLAEIFTKINYNQAVVFTNSRQEADAVCNFLSSRDLPAIVMHAGHSTEERQERFKKFKKYDYRILVTTDLMGRGIDVQEITLVINYDMPDTVETYSHRAGRAGRFETEGTVVSFVASDEDSVIINDIQRRYNVSIEHYD